MQLPANRRTRLENILGPLALSVGWAVLSLYVGPWLRDQLAAALLEGAPLEVSRVWPAPLKVAMAAFTGALLMVAGGGLLLSRVSRWSLWERPWSTLRLTISAASIAGVAGLPLFAGGEPVILDAKSHHARSWLWEESLRQGRWPIWTDLWYGGTPVDLHYPPLAHVLQATLGLLGFPTFAAAKLLAWICLVVGSVGFAHLCRRHYGASAPALLGGCLFAVAPALYCSWIWEGRMPGLVLLAIIPWSLLFLEQTLTASVRQARSCALLFGLSLWLLAIAHLGQARLAFGLLAVYTVVRGIPIWRRERHRASRSRFVWLGVGTLVGLVLVTAHVLPMFREADWVNDLIPSRLTGRASALPNPRALLDLFVWSPRGVHYLGVSIAVLAVIGIVKTGRDSRGPIGRLGLTALLVLPWFFCPPSGRGLDLIFIFGMLAAAGSVASRTRTVLVSRLLVFALVYLALDALPIRLVNTYSTHRGERNQAYAEFEQSLEGRRLLELPATPEGRAWPSHWYHSPFGPPATIGGPFIQGVPPAFGFASTVIDTVARQLATGDQLDAATKSLLAFHGIGGVLLASPGKVIQRIPIPNASLVSTMPSPSDRSILQPPPEIPIGPGGYPPEVSRAIVAAQFEWMRSVKPVTVPGVQVEIRPNVLRLSLPGQDHARQVRIARNHYPTTEVRIDGRPTETTEAPWGGIGIAVGPGPHEVEVLATLTPLRRTTNWVQAIGVALMLFSVLQLRKPHSDTAP